MNNLTIDNKSYLLPGSYNELSSKQLIQIAGVMLKKLPGKSFVPFLLILLNIKYKIFLYWKFLTKINRQQMNQMQPLTQFIFSETSIQKNVIPQIKHKGKIYIGPTDELKSLSVYEYIFAEKHYLDYYRTEKPESLDLLIAALYRPSNKLNHNHEDFDGDFRIKFSDDSAKIRAKELADLDFQTKYAIWILFGGMLCHLRNHFPTLFPKTDKEKQEMAKDSGSMWVEIIRKYNGSTVVSMDNKVGNLRAYNFFYDLEKMLIEESKNPKK